MLDQLRARHRRLHVARMHHARQLDVHGPFQRAVHLGGNVVALRRLADDLEFLHRLDLGHAGGRVDVVPRQRDIESSSRRSVRPYVTRFDGSAFTVITPSLTAS